MILTVKYGRTANACCAASSVDVSHLYDELTSDENTSEGIALLSMPTTTSVTAVDSDAITYTTGIRIFAESLTAVLSVIEKAGGEGVHVPLEVNVQMSYPPPFEYVPPVVPGT